MSRYKSKSIQKSRSSNIFQHHVLGIFQLELLGATVVIGGSLLTPEHPEHTNCATCNRQHCTSKIHSTCMYCEQDASKFGCLLEPSITGQPNASTSALRRTSTCPIHPDVFASITRREGMVESSHTCFAEFPLACRAKLVVCGRTRTEKGSSLSAAFRLQRHPHASIKNSDAFLTVQS